MQKHVSIYRQIVQCSLYIIYSVFHRVKFCSPIATRFLCYWTDAEPNPIPNELNPTRLIYFWFGMKDNQAKLSKSMDILNINDRDTENQATNQNWKHHLKPNQFRVKKDKRKIPIRIGSSWMQGKWNQKKLWILNKLIELEIEIEIE